MEYLIPPSRQTCGCVTLYKFGVDLRGPSARRDKGAIWRAVDRVLTVLESDRLVHGDLWPNHVMLEIDENGKLRFSASARGVNIRISTLVYIRSTL